MSRPVLDAAAVKALIAPDSVAIIGASDNIGRLTARPQAFLARHGYRGRVYPVNPRRETVQGAKAWPSVGALPEPPEHAYILLETDLAIEAVAECAAAGVKVATVLADGFAESGGEGVARQARLVAAACDGGIALVGPNSTGVVGTRTGFSATTNAAFALDTLPTGRTAVLSQSGSVIGAILSRGAAAGRGFGAFVSVGNEAALGVGELGEALVELDEFDSFALFLETLRRPDRVAAFARRARALGKPVTAFLVGRSEAGRALAQSHTGAMIGGARALSSFLEHHGVTIADTFEGMVDMAGALSLRRRVAGRPKRATVLTTTGGGGGMVYDGIALKGSALGGLPKAADAALKAQGLSIKPGPIVDVTFAGARYDTMRAVVTALAEDPETGLVVAAIGSSAQFNPELTVRPIVDAVAELGDGAAPVIAMPVPHAPESLALFNAGGIPAFRTVESCAQAVSALLAEPEPLPPAAAPLPAAVTARLDTLAEGLADEVASSAVLGALGIAVPASVVIGPDGDVPALGFAGPYVLKAVSADLPHKSEAGAVRLGLKDRAAVASAVAEMRAALTSNVPGAVVSGFVVAAMETGLGEAIVGLTRDPVTGPMISVGLGGVMTEIFADLAISPAPVSPGGARAMIASVKSFALLRGYRGAPEGDLEALADVVVRLSTLASDARVAEAEINPVLVRPRGDGVVALDAVIRLESPPV
ncbi:acetate--CoA ligase family protein [Acuticoccus sediminis]|uniref:acetate--CoA ligase family protein n=1 Tax=Acuticoccus sediminis TaxID=2184697 RepID=UPI001CFF006E|nr:acetate--CoA ligase family protein [Acuticoccus sediminis]